MRKIPLFSFVIPHSSKSIHLVVDVGDVVIMSLQDWDKEKYLPTKHISFFMILGIEVFQYYWCCNLV